MKSARAKSIDTPPAETGDSDLRTVRPAEDVAAERPCLRCRAPFWSEGFGERICARCKGSAVWRDASCRETGAGRRRSGDDGA